MHDDRDHLDLILEQCSRSELAPSQTLMQLVLAAHSPEEVERVLERHPQASDLRRLWVRDPGLWTRIKGVLELGSAPAANGNGDAVQHWAAAFDRAVALSPEASVAAYTLGDADTLREATMEVTRHLTEWGLLHPTAHVLELGCGIGRFAEAFAPLVSSYRGLDISPGMVAEARRRCAGFPTVSIDQTSGRDLAAIPSGSASFILAADVFPYLVEETLILARTHFHEIARVLFPSGGLVLINFSYRGNEPGDVRDVSRLAAEAGLRLDGPGERPFRLWDGLVFRLSRS